MRYLDVSGRHPLTQSGGAVLSLDLQQVGPDVTGTASWMKAGASNGPLLVDDDPTKVVSMELRGTVTDREFSFTIAWNDGTRGVYSGVVDGEGKMSGTTYDSMNPNGRRQSWAILPSKFRLAAEPAPAKKPAIKAMGRSKPKPKPTVGDVAGRLTDLSARSARPPQVPGDGS